MRKTPFVLLNAITIASLVLAACTPAATQAPAPTEDAGAQTEPTPVPDAGGEATTAPDTGGALVTVTFMTWEGNDTNAAIDAAVARFAAANPDIIVERVPTPNSGYGDRLNAMIQTGELPDIFWAGNDTEQLFGAQGLLYDWTATAQAETGDAFRLDQFAPGAIENWTSPDGKLYGLPSLMNTYGFWYNTALFEEAGVPLPTTGWTWDEFLAAAEALTVKDGDTVTRYGVYDTGNFISSPFGISNCSVSAGGAPWMDRIIEPSTIVADEAFVTCAGKIFNAVQQGWLTPPGYPGDGLNEAFLAGQVPMLFMGQWMAPTFIQGAPDFQVGFAPMPVESAVVQPYDAIGLVSPATIENPEAVWRVIKFLATDMWTTVLVDAPVAPAAHLPSSEAYFQTLRDAGVPTVAETVQYELEAPEKQGIRFTATWSSRANDVLGAAWNDIMTGVRPIEDIQTVVTDLNAVIANPQ